MPMVTFLGPFPFRRSPSRGDDDFQRNIARQVSQAWVDQWRHRLPESHWRIDGDEAPTIDMGNDGVPDSGWRRKDIMAWLDTYDARPSGYATKTQLLDIVEALLNPSQIDEVADLTSAEENVEEAPSTGEDEPNEGE